MNHVAFAFPYFFFSASFVSPFSLSLAFFAEAK